MKVVCISDTHRMHGYLDVPDGDILIHAGDFTDWGSLNDILDFSEWLKSLPHKSKIIVAGNHDIKFESYPEMAIAALKNKCKEVIYLNNKIVEVNGLKIFGCPYTPRFAGSFQLDLTQEGDKEFWETLIPDCIDILVTHGPPYGILDSVKRGFDGAFETENCGSRGLLDRVIKIKPKLHVFGHIHESYGKIKQRYGITFVNASCLNWRYNELNKPIVVEI